LFDRVPCWGKSILATGRQDGPSQESKMRTLPAVALSDAEALAGSNPAGGGGRQSHRGRPIDLVHLSRQTFGDKRLETELLRLFVRQSEQILASLETGSEPGLDRARPEYLLHLLLGSARAVGATAVADIAERLNAKRRGPDAASALSVHESASLRDAVRETNGFIAGLLDS
jgi:hypothetical protein